MSIEQKYVDVAVAHRRAIHRRPEPAWCEFETTYRVVTTLKSLGYEVKFGLDAIEPAAVMGRNETEVKAAIARALKAGVDQSFIDQTQGYTGAVGLLDTGREGPVTALRFDMDCVMVEECSDPAHEANVGGYASEIPGCMHSCGHDAHTATGLGVAQWIADHKDSLKGRFILLFQPGEEGTRGAKSLMQKGWVDHVNYLYCCHIGGDAKLGEGCIAESGFLATSKIDITFTGAPSHAGSDPEKGRSALMAAAAAALLMQGIPRHSQGASRISVGTLHAGEGRNVTPVHAKMQVETRGATHEINQYMRDNVYRICEGIEKTHDVKVDIETVGEGTTLQTTKEGTRILSEVMSEVLGDKFVSLPSPGASEDCTFLMRRAIEGGADCGYFMFGCNHKGHHRANFEIQDEVSLGVGLNILTRLVQRLNGRQ